MMSTWTQPVCDECFTAERPGRRPVRLREPDLERCCLCGAATRSGIYMRLDPNVVPYPRRENDD